MTGKFGIIGGMGVEAGEVFLKAFQQAFDKKGLNADNILLEANPNTPDRTEAILNGGQSPTPYIIEVANKLYHKGATKAIMACNTTHYFIDEVNEAAKLEVLDMIDITAKYINENIKNAEIALLATTATVQTRLYDKYIDNLHKPSKEHQTNNVHAAIYGADYGKNGIKNGVYDENAALLSIAIKELAEQGVNTFILGCTELPLVQTQLQANFPNLHFIDPMDIVIEKAIKIYKANEEEIESKPPFGGYVEKVSLEKERSLQNGDKFTA